MLKVAIIGLGTISSTHKLAIECSDIAKLVAVCDNNSEKAGDYSVPFYTDIEEMLKKEFLDCVHICLPHYLHVPVIRLCAEYKVNVFTEKPVALNYQEASSIFNLEEKYHIKIGVCLQNRYNQTVQQLKQEICTGKYGNFIASKGIVTWCREMSYYEEAPWRGKKKESGGGVMINQTIHTLDLLSYLVGDFRKIEGKVANFSLPNIEIEDTVMCCMEYDKGGKAIFFATVAYGDNSDIELEFIFEKAKFTIRNSKLYKTTEQSEKFLCEDKKLEGRKGYYGASHVTAIETFYHAILSDSNDYISVKEAAYSLQVMDGIFESSCK